MLLLFSLVALQALQQCLFLSFSNESLLFLSNGHPGASSPFRPLLITSKSGLKNGRSVFTNNSMTTNDGGTIVSPPRRITQTLVEQGKMAFFFFFLSSQ
jgi:hypothetical protein